MATAKDIDPERMRAWFAAGLGPCAIARLAGCSHGTVGYWRAKLGFAVRVRPRKVDPARLRELHALRKSDREIGREFGVTAGAVKRVRQRLGLPAAGARASEEYRSRQRATYLRQVAEAGVRSLAQLAPAGYVAARRDLATRYGLPGDLYATQVRVVVALARGPLTARQLADACGRKAGRPNPYHRFNYPKCPGSNYLSDLVRRGLVARRPLPRGEGNGSGRGESVYLLTPAAMDMLSSPKEKETTT